MEWDKQLQQLSERLNYMRDIFPDKHLEDLSLLGLQLDELRHGIARGTIKAPREGIESLENLFFFISISFWVSLISFEVSTLSNSSCFCNNSI